MASRSRRGMRSPAPQAESLKPHRAHREYGVGVSDRALVTGAAGFMGSHVVDGCLERGLDVLAVDDLSGGYQSNVSDQAEWMEGDVRDADLVRSIWEQHGPFRFVYHL